MKIKGLIKKAKWEHIECCCVKGDISKSFPLINCDSCKYQRCWDSVPQKDFKINKFDKQGKIIGTKTVNEITLVRGSVEDIIGWEHNF